jgi:hypothetical protein
VGRIEKAPGGKGCARAVVDEGATLPSHILKEGAWLIDAQDAMVLFVARMARKKLLDITL